MNKNYFKKIKNLGKEAFHFKENKEKKSIVFYPETSQWQ